MTKFLPFSEGSPGFALAVAADEALASKTPRLGDKEWNALIGIVTAIVGNVLISFALNLQRYAHIRLNRNKLRKSRSWKSKNRSRNGANAPASYGTTEAERDGRSALRTPSRGSQGEDETSPFDGRYHRSASTSHLEGQDEAEEGKSYLRSPLWWLGITLMTVGEAGNFLAYGFAPASIVSPLGVVALISNCIIAPCLLHERFRQQDFWGVVIAVGGVVTVVLSAANSENRLGPHEIWDAITRWEFQLYLGLTLGAIVLLVWMSRRYGDRTVLIDVGLVALFGGYTALSTKGVASLLSGSLWRAVTFPISYLLAFILVATALLQIRYLNKALQRFDSTQVIPTQFVCFTISVIVGSAILYRDFESADAERVGKFIGGCALTFLGVYFITSGRGGSDDAEDEDDGSVEEGIHLMSEERRPLTPENKRQTSAGAAGDGQDEETPRNARQSIASRRSSQYGTLPRLDSTSTPQQGAPERRSSSDSEAEISPADTPTKPPLPKSSTTSSVLRRVFDPQPPSQADSPARPGLAGSPSVLQSRKSISRLMPGPLSSPLSSPLSGIVVDTLRKGLDSPSRPRPSRLPGLRRFRSEQDRDDEAPEEPNRPHAQSSLRAQLQPEDAEPSSPRRTSRRTRSVSDVLGKIFQTRRGQGRQDGGSHD